MPPSSYCSQVGGQSNRAILTGSASGSYLALVWPATCTYMIYYRTMTGEFSECDRGVGISVAWHSHKDMFAVLQEPQVGGGCAGWWVCRAVGVQGGGCAGRWVCRAVGVQGGGCAGRWVCRAVGVQGHNPGISQSRHLSTQWWW
jgi:hypothetical protein